MSHNEQPAYRGCLVFECGHQLLYYNTAEPQCSNYPDCITCGQSWVQFDVIDMPKEEDGRLLHENHMAIRRLYPHLCDAITTAK